MYMYSCTLVNHTFPYLKKDFLGGSWYGLVDMMTVWSVRKSEVWSSAIQKQSNHKSLPQVTVDGDVHRNLFVASQWTGLFREARGKHLTQNINTKRSVKPCFRIFFFRKKKIVRFEYEPFVSKLQIRCWSKRLVLFKFFRIMYLHVFLPEWERIRLSLIVSLVKKTLNCESKIHCTYYSVHN